MYATAKSKPGPTVDSQTVVTGSDADNAKLSRNAGRNQNTKKGGCSDKCSSITILVS